MRSNTLYNQIPKPFFFFLDGLLGFRLGRSGWFAGRIALRVSFFSGRFCFRFRLGRCGLRAGLVIPSGGSSRRICMLPGLLLSRMFAGRLAICFFQESCHSFVLFAIDKCIEVSGYPLGLRGHRRQAEYTHCYYCFFHTMSFIYGAQKTNCFLLSVFPIIKQRKAPVFFAVF